MTANERFGEAFAALLRDAAADALARGESLSRRSLRRLQRRAFGRIGAIAGATTAAAVLVAFAAAPVLFPGEAKALPSLTPSPLPSLDTLLATFPLGGGPEYEGVSALEVCGGPAPTSRTEGAALSLTATRTDSAPLDVSLDIPVSVVLSEVNNVGERREGATSGITFLFVQDGVIVGWRNWTEPRSGQVWAPDIPRSTVAKIDPRFTPCDPSLPTSVDQEGNVLATLPIGSYDVYVATRAFATEETAALADLGPNVVVTNAAAYNSPIYAPGSYDCRIAVSLSWYPRSCLEQARRSATVNTSSGIVIMSYDTEHLPAPFDETFVTQPIELTVTDSGTPPPPDPAPETVLTSLDQLHCGATFTALSPSQTLRTAVAIGPYNSVFPGTFRGAIMATDVLGTANITLEPGALLWFFAYVEADPLAETESYLVAAATAPIALAEPVAFDRYVGPPEVAWIVGEPTVCPDLDPTAIPVGPVLAATWTIEQDGSATSAAHVSQASDFIR